jgi:hypothetical protein
MGLCYRRSNDDTVIFLLFPIEFFFKIMQLSQEYELTPAFLLPILTKLCRK